MAITIDYSTFTINVPRTDMLLVSSSPTEIRELNINDFRQELNDLMDDVEGMAHPTNHEHTAPKTVAGVTLARVVEIINGYTITFEDGQYNVNIVGGNSNISDVVNKNQVGVNTANSAGLQDPFALQAGAYEGEVTIDVTSTITGTTFPKGTHAFPVNNLADALAIAQERGLERFRIVANATFSSGDFSDGYTFFGDNPNVTVTLNAGVDISGCTFRNLTIQGTLDNSNTLRECVILDLNLFNGYIFQCGISGTLSLGGTATAAIMQSFSLVAGGGAAEYPEIDLGGVCQTPLLIRDWNGGIGFKNCSDLQSSVSVDASSGRVVFANTITDGTYTVRGVADVEDNSVGATVNDLTLNAKVNNLKGGFR